MKTWEQISSRHLSAYKPCPACGGPMARHAEFCKSCSPNIRGENHYAWKGDAARATTKRGRGARKRPSPGRDRHHIDGDPGNNSRENLLWLCCRCHMLSDGRLFVRDVSGRFAA